MSTRKGKKNNTTNIRSSLDKPSTPAQEKNNGRFTHILMATGIAAVLFLVYYTSLDNQFTNWDDPGYINDNVLVKDLSWQGIKHMFTTPVMANYHPLTILSYAIEYSKVQLEPWLYHFDSLWLHILITILVYWLVWLLTHRIAAAIVTALLFGIHPMHVESVAWISGRKDVLYGLFYMAACVCYIYYTRSAGRRAAWYVLLIGLFVCSLLSKPVAVTLPLVFLLVDYFEQRHFDKKALLEKVPFFLLSLIFGLVAVFSQRHAGAMVMQTAPHLNVVERVTMAMYALFTYLSKVVFPIHLACFYPYPGKVAGAIPPVYYIYPALVCLLVFAAWKFGRKNRVFVFGALFFIAHILLLLQFLAVGDAIVADRYTYLPYFGLFFIAGWYVSSFFETGIPATRKYTAFGASVLGIGVLAWLSYQRSLDWHDPVSLWRADIENEPVLAPNAYNNLGFIYYTKWGKAADPDTKKIYFDSAQYLLNNAVKIKPDFVNPYVSLGEMERTMGQYDEAKKNYYAALKIKPKESNLYLGLGILYLIIKNNDSADYCFKQSLVYNPAAEPHGNYANFLMLTGKKDSALKEYNIAVSMNTETYSIFLNRGKLLKDMNRWDEALVDLDKAVKLNPDLGDLYYERSFCYAQKGNKSLALSDVEKAIALGYNRVDNNYYEGLKR